MDVWLLDLLKGILARRIHLAVGSSALTDGARRVV